MRKLLFICFLLGCAGADRNRSADVNTLVGIWTYEECTIKNTSVRGTAEFKNNGTLVLNIRARDDYPVRDNLRGTYRYSVKGNRIETDYKGGYGMDEYFYLSGNFLYLSRSGIENIIDDPRQNTFNWSYRLIRGKR